MKSTVTALMPMKGHSERVPRKNVRLLAGRPLFHWMMDALRGSRYVDEIVVNTDSPEIAEMARREFGATILERPEHLLGDLVGIQPLIEWDLAHTSGALYLQTHSTNPLMRVETVDRAIEAFLESASHDSLFTVTPLRKRFYWPDGSPVNHDPQRLLRTQDLAPIYEENSCLYLFSRRTFEDTGHRIGTQPLLYPMDPIEAIDIDEETDFAIASAIMEAQLATRQRRQPTIG